MPIRRRTKTEFGQEVARFSLETNLTVKDIALACGLNYSTVIDTTVGRAAGVEVIPKVREFMSEYLKQHKGA